MKKTVFLVSLLCITIAASAQSITGTSIINLSTTGQPDKELGMILSPSLSDGFDNSWDAYAANESGIYVYSGGKKFTTWASNQYSANLPLGFYTGENTAYTLKFSNFSGTSYTIYDRVAGKTITVASSTNIQIDGVDADPANQYSFTIDEGLKNSQINDRFFINYEATKLDGLFGWGNYIDLIPQGDGTCKVSVNFTSEGYYTFKVVEGANWYGNTTAFKRDYITESAIVNNNDMTLWVDAKDEITFTWEYASNTITIGYPALPTVTVRGTGSFYDQGYDVVLTPAADELTASGTITFPVEKVGGPWYNFKVVVGSEWRSNESEFSRTTTSADWINNTLDGNMYFDIDQAGEYTFTWSFVNNQLTIGFPAPAPVYAAEVTTNAYGLATFSYGSDLVAVEGDAKLYKGDLDGETLVLTQVDYVKAGEGVIVYNEAGTATTYHFNAGTGTSSFSGNELLAASAWEYPHAGFDTYVLSGSSLYLYQGTSMKPNKAYLKVAQNTYGGAPKHISFRFNQSTAIESAEAAELKAEKFVENGVIYIRRGNEVFNLQGQKVNF